MRLKGRNAPGIQSAPILTERRNWFIAGDSGGRPTRNPVDRKGGALFSGGGGVAMAVFEVVEAREEWVLQGKEGIE